MPARLFETTILFAATASICSLIVDTAATADDEGPTISANTRVISDYRFRGVSLSHEDFALQGGMDIALRKGFHAGTWGSSIENFNGAEAEIDIYGGYGFTVATLDIDIGLTGYLYPGGDDTDYVEPYMSVGASLGGVSLKGLVAYAPEQANLGSTDNIYLAGDADIPLAHSPVTLSAHIGWEDGALGNDKVDWRLGVHVAYRQLSFGLDYVDTTTAGPLTNAAVLASVGASF